MHSELTLNILHLSHQNPKLSAYVQLEVAFDYNRRPLVQPSVKILVFENPDQRGSWPPYSIDGW